MTNFHQLFFGRPPRVRVVRGAHDDGHYKHGPIIVVEDLSDPSNPGQTKTLYVHRISDMQGESSDSDSEESVDEGDLVTVCRADTVEGIVIGRVVGKHGYELTVKPPDSRRTCKVDRRHVRKTSIATINRKTWAGCMMRKRGRRKRGLGPVV